MVRPGKLFVRESAKEARSALSDLVMAWARDSETGEARYILELGPERRGAKSGCECAHCGLPLTAVNAAKAEFVRRPHFRHPEGAAEKAACRVLAARGAILRALGDDGWIQLPGRRRSSRFAGLSGESYDAHAEHPSERRRIADLDLSDRAVAVLTLDDGRKVRVLLTGSADDAPEVLDADGLPMPTIVMDVAEAGVAAMSPEDIRRRLSLLPEELTWHRHWRDGELDELARRAAHTAAAAHLDAAPAEGVALAGDDALRARAQLLHEAVGAILDAADRIWVPGWEAVARTTERIGLRTGDKSRAVPPHWVRLLERSVSDSGAELAFSAQPEFEGGEPMDKLVVRLVCSHPAPPEPPPVEGANVLELDLVRAGRGLTTESLRNVVVDAALPKRWLAVAQRDRLVAELRRKLARDMAESAADLAARRATPQADMEERCLRLRTLPFEDLAVEYRQAALAWFEALGEGRAAAGEAAKAGGRFAAARRVFRQHGYPEADTEQFADARGLLVGLMSIQLGRPLAGFSTMRQVLEAYLPLERSPLFPNHTLFLIAMHAFAPTLAAEDRVFAERWAAVVRGSLRRGEEVYERTGTFDRLISLVLPEMAVGLEKRAGRRPRPAERADSNGQYVYKPGDEQFRGR